MKDEHGKIPGPISVSDNFRLHGMVEGNVTVVDGGKFDLKGMVVGDVVVEAGGYAMVYGTVTGNVVNQGGRVYVAGLVHGELRDTVPEAHTRVQPGSAVIGGRHRR